MLVGNGALLCLDCHARFCARGASPNRQRRRQRRRAVVAADDAGADRAGAAGGTSASNISNRTALTASSKRGSSKET